MSCCSQLRLVGYTQEAAECSTPFIRGDFPLGVPLISLLFVMIFPVLAVPSVEDLVGVSSARGRGHLRRAWTSGTVAGRDGLLAARSSQVRQAANYL